MNETPPVNEPLVDPASAQSRNKIEKSLSDRILGYAFLASVVVNVGWIALVSHSNLFGGGSVLPQLHERPVKIFKPIPIKPKPKPVKPPPPPPKPKVQPKIKPLEHVRPHPTPPRPTPTRVINVAHSNNSHAQPTPAMPTSPPTNDQSPPNPGPPSPPAPKAPPTPPAPPAPPAAPPPTPPAPKAPPPAPPPPPPPLPPPPPPRPRNYSPIAFQEALFPDVSGDVSLDGIDPNSITPGTVVISFVIDGTGRVRGAHVTKTCGNSEIDNRFLEAVKRTRGTPAIQEHIPHDESQVESFPVGNS